MILAVPYLLQWWRLRRGDTARMEQLNLASVGVHHLLKLAWASGTLRCPEALAKGMALNLDLVYAGLYTCFEPVSAVVGSLGAKLRHQESGGSAVRCGAKCTLAGCCCDTAR